MTSSFSFSTKQFRVVLTQGPVPGLLPAGAWVGRPPVWGLVALAACESYTGPNIPTMPLVRPPVTRAQHSHNAAGTSTCDLGPSIHRDAAGAPVRATLCQWVPALAPAPWLN